MLSITQSGLQDAGAKPAEVSLKEEVQGTALVSPLNEAVIFIGVPSADIDTAENVYDITPGANVETSIVCAPLSPDNTKSPLAGAASNIIVTSAVKVSSLGSGDVPLSLHPEIIDVDIPVMSHCATVA